MSSGIRTTKGEVLQDALEGRGCLGRALEDEPVFVVRARDVCALRTVHGWIKEASLEGSPADKIADATEVLKLMAAWRQTHTIKIPD